MRVRERLKPIDVKRLAKRPGLHNDGNGLGLVVSNDCQQRYWTLRYRLHGKSHMMGLGSLDVIGIAEARDRAQAARLLILDGIDPIQERRQRKAAAALEAARSVTFKTAAEQYIEQHRPGWRNPKHAAQWSSTLATYAYPIIGSLPVASVDTPHILKVLRPIWTDKTETATRLRGRLENILDYATVAGYRTGLNPARWKGHLSHMLAKPSTVKTVEHHEALPYAEVPAFMIELHERESIAARALELAILTATRTGEVLGARWDEIDLAAKLWTIPAERMKAKRAHAIPLAPAAVRLLKAMKENATGDLVFAGQQEGKPLSNMSMAMLLRRMGRDDITVHGFRSTFRDWAGERTAFDRETVEFALAHGLPDKTEAAYRRGTALDKRRQLMSAWAQFCDGKVVETARVIPLREGVPA